jgi:hypothetical protein
MIVAWAMLEQSWDLHALTHLNHGGMFRTACNGGWPITCNYSLYPVESPPGDQKCPACVAMLVEDAHLKAAGLRALADSAYSVVGTAVKRFAGELAQFSPDDAKGFEQWLGPCSHGQSPITRCTTCAPATTQHEGT